MPPSYLSISVQFSIPHALSETIYSLPSCIMNIFIFPSYFSPLRRGVINVNYTRASHVPSNIMHGRYVTAWAASQILSAFYSPKVEDY